MAAFTVGIKYLFHIGIHSKHCVYAIMSTCQATHTEKSSESSKKARETSCVFKTLMQLWRDIFTLCQLQWCLRGHSRYHHKRPDSLRLHTSMVSHYNEGQQRGTGGTLSANNSLKNISCTCDIPQAVIITQGMICLAYSDQEERGSYISDNIVTVIILSAL